MFASVSPTGALIFKPRPSSAWRGLFAGGILFFAVALGVVLFLRFAPTFLVVLWCGIAVALGLFMFALALFFRRAIDTMRYEVSDTTLTLVGGPVRYEIPLASIRRIYSRDIDTSLRNRPKVKTVTAVNTPGLALSIVTWKDTGQLKMCATSQATNIMLIETEGTTYGITPADEASFLDALHQAGVTAEGVDNSFFDSPEPAR